MRRTLVAAALAFVGVITGAAASASGPTADVRLTQSNWYWQTQPSAVTGMAGVRTDAPDPSVPSGDLAVAGPTANGGAQKETYLQFDLSALPADAEVTSFVVTLPVDPNPQAVTATNGSLPPVVACAVTQPWSGGPGGESFNGKPADSCSGAIALVPNSAGTAYSADVTRIARSWFEGGLNNGIAITDDPNNSTRPYQVTFGPATALQHLNAKATYSPAAQANTQTAGLGTSTLPTFSGGQTTLPPGGGAPQAGSSAPAATGRETVPAARISSGNGDFPPELIPAVLVIAGILAAMAMILRARNATSLETVRTSSSMWRRLRSESRA